MRRRPQPLMPPRDTSTSMRPADGPSALATFENARDSARASLGASVFGVTAALAAAAGATPRAIPAAGAVAGPWKRLGIPTRPAALSASAARRARLRLRIIMAVPLYRVRLAVKRLGLPHGRETTG